MKKILYFSMLLAVVCVLINSCSSKNKTEEWDLIKYVSNMAIDEKIGQLIAIELVPYESKRDSLSAYYDAQISMQSQDAYFEPESRAENVTTLNKELAGIISKYHIGGVCLNHSNINNEQQLKELTYSLHGINDDGRHILIMINEEGTDAEYTCIEPSDGFLPNASIKDTEEAYDRGKVLGRVLIKNGIDCNLSPIADGNYNPNNPLLKERAFSDNPEIVSADAVAMMHGIESVGAVSCVKYFPGFSDVYYDDNVNMYYSNVSLPIWTAREAQPFVNCVANGAHMVMVSHVAYPALDSSLYDSPISNCTIFIPSSLSNVVVSDWLKNKLGYEGVVISDSLSSPSISSHFSPDEAFIKALNAGVDIALNPVIISCYDDIENISYLYEKVIDSLEDGTLSMERLDDAVSKVIQLKYEIGLLGE